MLQLWELWTTPTELSTYSQNWAVIHKVIHSFPHSIQHKYLPNYLKGRRRVIHLPPFLLLVLLLFIRLRKTRIPPLNNPSKNYRYFTKLLYTFTIRARCNSLFSKKIF